jgi:hypothetical protein
MIGCQSVGRAGYRWNGPGWDLMTTGRLYRAVREESYSFKSLRPRRRIFTECLLSVIKRSQLYFYCPNLVKHFTGVKADAQQRSSGKGCRWGGRRQERARVSAGRRRMAAPAVRPAGRPLHGLAGRGNRLGGGLNSLQLNHFDSIFEFSC